MVATRFSRLGWLCAFGLVSLQALPAAAQSDAEDSAASTIVLDPMAPALEALIGRPVLRLQVQQSGRLWKSPVKITAVKVGDPLNGASARRAARELLDSGGFARVQIDVTPLDAGVALVFEAEPRRLLAARRLVGSAFEDSEVWRQTPLGNSEQLTEQMLPRIGEAVRALHARRGYLNAKVEVSTRETDDPTAVVLVVDVTRGPAARFSGRQISLVDTLLADRRQAAPRSDLEQLGELIDSYEVDRGSLVDEVLLDDADRKLTEALRARAYASATVSHVVGQVGRRPFLWVQVSPGAHTRIRFEGNHTLDADQLLDAIDYDRETDRSAGHLATKVQAAYRAMGLMDATVSVQERGDPGDPIHDMVFVVREGDPVRVVSRSFPCLTGDRSPSEVAAEIDSFLEEDLPGAGLLGPVDSATLDQSVGPLGPTGARPAPMPLEPTRVFVPSVYDKAIKHVQDLYRSEGYLSAIVGPVQLVRRRCDRHSPPGKCIAVAQPAPENRCLYDPRGLPIEEPELPTDRTCHPDLKRGISCEPNLQVLVPVKLGPRATLYDLAFEGNNTLVEAQLAREAALTLGAPASNLELEQARRRLLDAYRERGFAFADVRATLELSPDHTRARAHFAITEGELVTVDRVIVEGATHTSEALILRRVVLEPGKPYRQSLVRRSEELIATLGTFSTVSISLQDPFVPARRKTVVVHVQERPQQYLDIRPGFSTGEGFRIQFEYGHRNVGGEAILFTFRIRLGYLPDMFILDPDVRRNLDTLPVAQRMERVNTASLLFPEVGLGPLISLGVDGIDVRSNARDYGLSKDALSTAFNYRPIRGVTASLGGSFERNDVAIFNGQTVEQYLSQPGVTSDLWRLLRVPDGLTYAVAQRITGTWDRRDNPFGATRGTLLNVAVEHVHAFPAQDNPNTLTSDFLRTSGTLGGYVRLSRKGLAWATSVRGGYIYQLSADSKTYPDRLFFLGGVDSIRGFLQDSLVPQDVADKLQSAVGQAASDPTRLTINEVGIRGGDVFINPRTELRIPLANSVQTALFVDAGNVWVEPRNFNPLLLRYAAGSGLRITTPIGPIAFDYGINLSRRFWEDFGAFHFSIGLF